MDIHYRYAFDSKGRSRLQPDQLSRTCRRIAKLNRSVYGVDRRHDGLKCFVENVIGDILPVRLKRNPRWIMSPSIRVVRLMGLENMMYAMIDHPTPSRFTASCGRHMEFVGWLEAEQLLVLNSGNDYVGAGSYDFTTEPDSAVRTEGC